MNFATRVLYTSFFIREILESEDFLILTQKFSLNYFAKPEIILSAEFTPRFQLTVLPINELQYLLPEEQLIFSDWSYSEQLS